jgi:phosphoribosyl 1,2-cyclic phosphate phosphodiesterase
MKITILGSGTSTGVPMVGCSCRVCTSPEPRDKRTRSSILIETSGKYILVDTSTDLRKQAIRENIPRIDAVLFTHSHADHIHGIDDLRGFHFLHKRLIPCFASRETFDRLSGNFSYIFKGMESEGYAPLLEPHVVSRPFGLFGKTVRPIPLIHGASTATGYRIDDMAYLTDCSAIPQPSLALLGGLDLLIIDALRYTPHFTHFNIDAALAVVEELKPRLAVFTHLTHEVSCHDGDRLPAGVELAYDGMVLEA